MKNLPLLFMGPFLFPIYSNAGRESHGWMPGIGFSCVAPADKTSRYRADLVVEDRRVISGKLGIEGRLPLETLCIDVWATRTFGAGFESTAFCANPQETEFLLELLESKEEAQLKIWKIEPGNSATLLEVLPCS